MGLDLRHIAVMPARSAGIHDFLPDVLYDQVVDTRPAAGHDDLGAA